LIVPRFGKGLGLELGFRVRLELGLGGTFGLSNLWTIELEPVLP